MGSQKPDFLEERPIGQLLLQFSAPAITATLVSATYSFVARIFVGWKIGMIGIAALTVSYPVMLTFLAFAMMIATGTTTLISLHLGERKHDRAERLLGQALFMYLVLSILFMTFGQIYLEDLLRLFGASDEVIPYAKSYLSIIIWGTFFQQISFGVNNFIRAEGHPNIAMVSMLISAIANGILDWFFLIYLETGIWGAGLANVLALIISSIWVSWLYLSGRTVLKWRLKYIFRPDFSMIKLIILYGTAPLVMQICSAVINGFQYHLLGYYGGLYGERLHLTGINGGDLAIGILGTLFAISMLVVMPILGLSQGMQPIIGYNVGAVRPERVLRTLSISLFYGVFFSLFFWLIALIRPDWLLYPFMKTSDPAYAQMMALGISATRIVLFSIPLVSINIIAGGYFQAHGRPILSLILTMLRQLILLLPFLILFPLLAVRYHLADGLDACWFAFPASDTLACLVSVYFLYREYVNKRNCIRIPPIQTSVEKHGALPD